MLLLQITKTADGYQPHLVSPERGLQLMASKALDLVVHPVEDCVHAVYNLLVTGGGKRACNRSLGKGLAVTRAAGWEQGHAEGITHGPLCAGGLPHVNSSTNCAPWVRRTSSCLP